MFGSRATGPGMTVGFGGAADGLPDPIRERAGMKGIGTVTAAPTFGWKDIGVERTSKRLPSVGKDIALRCRRRFLIEH